MESSRGGSHQYGCRSQVGGKGHCPVYGEVGCGFQRKDSARVGDLTFERCGHGTSNYNQRVDESTVGFAEAERHERHSERGALVGSIDVIG
jgi:hypothetical protein